MINRLPLRIWYGVTTPAIFLLIEVVNTQSCVGPKAFVKTSAFIFIRRYDMKFFKPLLLIICVLFANAVAWATDNEGILPKLNIKASGNFDVYSKYIWRGFTLDKDPVLQPGFSLSGNGLAFSYWSSWDFDNNDALDGDEIDYVIDYTKDFKDISLSAGHTYYEFPGTDTFSKEFYVGASFNNISLAPSITYYYDYGDEQQGGADGQYLALTGLYRIGLVKDLGIALDMSGKLAYNKELFIVGEGGDALMSAALITPLYKNLTLATSVNYASTFGDMKDSGDGNQRDKFYYGFSLSYEF